MCTAYTEVPFSRRLVPSFLCANMPTTTKTSDESDSRNDEIVYDGNPLQFFVYDRQLNSYAKKKLGDSGTKIWSNTTRTPTTANRAAIATDWVADVQDTKGYKEVALMDADTTWKTAPKLKSSISYMMRLREPLLAMLRILSKHCEKQNFQKQERSRITSSPLQMHLRLKHGKHC